MIQLITSGWSITLVGCSIDAEESILSYKFGIFFDITGDRSTVWDYHDQTKKYAVELEPDHRGRNSEVVIFDGKLKLIKQLILDSHGKKF